MGRMTSLTRAALPLSAALAGILVVYIALWSPQQQGDPHFDARVATPSYAANRPRVYFDETWSQGLYGPFVDLVEHDGYAVVRHKGRLVREELKNFDVLVVPIAMGFKQGVKTLPGLRHNLKGDAFTHEESAAVKNWVDGGGALLLTSDYASTAKSADTLAQQFGIRFLDGWAIEPHNHDADTGPLGFVVFSRGNGQLVQHPVTRGLDRVMTFTGQAMLFPDTATPFLKMSPEARIAPYRENQQRLETVPAAGAAQGVALESERGRVVVVGEATMLTSVLVRTDGTTETLGMGHTNCDNRQLALNIMHWLSRL
jgi:hypothetical protein